MILSPPEYQDSLAADRKLDNPGARSSSRPSSPRSTLKTPTASAPLVNSAITPPKSDNAISFGASSAGNTPAASSRPEDDLLPAVHQLLLNLGVT